MLVVSKPNVIAHFVNFVNNDMKIMKLHMAAMCALSGLYIAEQQELILSVSCS